MAKTFALINDFQYNILLNKPKFWFLLRRFAIIASSGKFCYWNTEFAKITQLHINLERSFFKYYSEHFSQLYFLPKIHLTSWWLKSLICPKHIRKLLNVSTPTLELSSIHPVRKIFDKKYKVTIFIYFSLLSIHTVWAKVPLASIYYAYVPSVSRWSRCLRPKRTHPFQLSSKGNLF